MILWDNLLDKSVVDRQTLIEKCILHDVGEVFSGDIHYQLKKFAPEICDVEDRFVRSRVTDGHCLYKYLGVLTDDNSLKTNEYVMMKFCDMLELLLYCCEERVAGSNYLEDVLHRAYNICEGFLSEHSWLNCNWIRDLLGEIKDEFLVGSNL
jgi:5'-deoxynucleotidase YfbR-like HD superfamily hydrolase